MPLDAVCLSALAEELDIAGMRIDKIQQPGRDEIILTIRGAGGSRKLLISANASNARVHFTEIAYENPQSPPMFCMLLRKHLQGAKISAVITEPMERVLTFEMEAYDEMGVLVQKRLVLEIMGRNSNIILTGGDGIIIDCLRRVDAEMSEKRQVLPGLLYRLPPKQDKLNPLATTREERRVRLDECREGERLSDWLLDNFAGLSPLVCRELCHTALGDHDARQDFSESQKSALLEALDSFIKEVNAKDFSPYMLFDGEKPKDFSFMPITQYDGRLRLEPFDSFSAMLETYYTRRDRQERLRQRAQAMRKSVSNLRDRTGRRLALQKEELQASENRERLRELGDIITANLHLMKKGEPILTAIDFYSSDGSEIQVKLDPQKSPQQNAAKYYKDYARAKKAEEVLAGQIEKGEAELSYLSSVLDEIDRAEGEADLLDIRRELENGGILKKQGNKKKERIQPSRPLRFVSSTGMEILVGRNNVQNDVLTLKESFKSDMWLHSQKIHGSHVIISCKGEEPDEGSILEAAGLAAYYSEARESQNVPVDYTLVKNVKKPAGSRPGMVIYTNYKTVYVNPERI